MREKEGYRVELENIRAVFGEDRNSLTVDEVAQYLRVDRRTVVKKIKAPKHKNPLPAINLGSEARPTYSISVPLFASWRCG